MVGGRELIIGIPHGHSGSAHPIADKFTSGSHSHTDGSGLTGSSGGKLDNSLDNYGGQAGSGSHGSHSGALGAGAAGLGAGALGAGAASGHRGQEAVSGEYAGSGTNDALTGESEPLDHLRRTELIPGHATRTGAGVGPLGENTSSGVGAGAGAGAGGLATAKSGVDTTGVDVDSSKYGTGVGASGGAGGHYDESSSRTGTGAGLAAGAAGAGALGAGAAAGHHGSTSDSASGTSGGSSGKTGRFGTVEEGFERGAPVSDPKALDSGGPHSLVFQESTGKYVHRHELEGAGSATKH